MFYSISVEQVEEAKFLGITFDETLAWNEHVDNMITKMGKDLSTVIRCGALLSANTVRKIMQALILSHIDYYPMIWSSGTTKNIKRLQIIQKRAARVVLKADYKTNIRKTHKHFGCFLVKNRISYSLVVFMRTAVYNGKPDVLFQNLPFSQNKLFYLTG